MIFDNDKIFWHIDRLSNWHKKKPVKPITAEIDMTNQCNSNCPGCVGGRTGEEKLSLKEAKKIINQLVKNGIKGLIFTGGGEPLCNPYTINAIGYAHDKGLKVGLITNGISIKSRIEMELLLVSCEWIRFSLDAGSPEVYKITHGQSKEVFNHVKRNIKEYINLKKLIGIECKIGTAYLTGKKTDNKDYMIDFLNTSERLGVDYAQFRPYLSSGIKDLSQFNKIDFTQFKSSIMVYSKHKYDCINQGNIEPDYYYCHSQQFAITITAVGDVTICCHTRGIPEFTIGNILNQSLKSILKSKKRQTIVDNINIKNCPKLCRGDALNRILNRLDSPKEHKEFL
jgi:radical SAM protein with 4Fe4S-binding SPASM domain